MAGVGAPFEEGLVGKRDQIRMPSFVVRTSGFTSTNRTGLTPSSPNGSAIVVVPDADALYRSFADGLRSAYGKLPRSGIRASSGPVRSWEPSLGQLRGSQWKLAADLPLRRSKETGDHVNSLALVLRSAARQGDDAAAIKMLDAGLACHAGAPVLATRMGDRERVEATLAEIRALDLDDDVRVIAAADLATAAEIERDLAWAGCAASRRRTERTDGRCRWPPCQGVLVPRAKFVRGPGEYGRVQKYMGSAVAVAYQLEI